SLPKIAKMGNLRKFYQGTLEILDNLGNIFPVSRSHRPHIRNLPKMLSKSMVSSMINCERREAEAPAKRELAKMVPSKWSRGLKVNFLVDRDARAELRVGDQARMLI